VKRDERTGQVKLIEVNPRFSGTADCARYMGVPVGWIHYLDLIGRTPDAAVPTRYAFRHVVIIREAATVPQLFDLGLLTWRQLVRSYRGRLHFYDFDARDPSVTLTTLRRAGRSLVGGVARNLGLRRRRPAPN
jgi:D-aspartate ligase